MKRVILLFCVFYTFMQATFDHPKLLIKIPTRSRPEQFFRRLEIYYAKLSQKVDVVFLITCDNDDCSMNNQKVKDRLMNYPNLYFYFGNNKSKIAAYNADIEKHQDFDIILVTSDDMLPIVSGYDKIIVDEMKRAFPDFDGVLNFHDGHLDGSLNTLPIIGKKFYDRFGYVYHPDYISFCCDNELTEVSKRLHKEKVINRVIIEHKHVAWGKAAYDHLYKWNEQFMPQDRETYRIRASHNFYLN